MVPAMFVVAALAAAAAWPDPADETAAPPVLAIPTRPADPLAPAASAVRAYIPDNAGLAVHVRLAQLVKTNLWKMLADPALGMYPRIAADLPLAIDLERDVVAVALVTSPEYLLGEAPLGMALELSRDAGADALPKDARPADPVPGSPAPVYQLGPEGVAALPAPRIVLLASSRECLAAMLAAAARPDPAPLGDDPLAAPGEVTFAARMPPALKDRILEEYQRFQRQTLRPHMDTDALMAFALYYNLVRIGVQATSMTGSLDLAREKDALRAEMRFASPEMAPFMADLLQALADPLRMGLPGVLGGRPLDEPPSQPFYRATADRATVRVAMARDTVYQFVGSLVDTTRDTTSDEAGRKASAQNLRSLGAAILAYFAAEGAFPRTWSDLTRANLIRDPAIFRNPTLATHLPAGDYELVPLTKRATQRDWLMAVLAYEVYPPDAQPQRLNVLFADGHVEYVDTATFRRLYQQTLESLGR
ncbi:MAG TPA: hypothetical protein VM431_01025 [Phycisphaerae bacterium]|nr:hypothetical protein [Phycisphaerae bacterium]